ncbi:MAG: DUF2334 domain-containing protein [Burkholderiaceae bacterium]|nr:DUF2334 domain-containing protein [Burkholderiaceae bacterium]MEB2317248.1 DUF2334 domain-containing protein [Pseudomonadota bacterium]
MSARYLIRFDDVCPTMDWSAWDAIEDLLQARRIRPLLAVVPDNRDPKLAVAPPRVDFWDRVRRWQADGWTIALHGYQHLYVSSDAGLMGINGRSEFAGLAESEQRDKLSAALAIFAAQDVRAEAWIAPAHAFDATTVRLLLELGIDTISDGFSPWPGRDDGGSLWIPQQLWRLRPMPFGVWTVCYHANGWSPERIRRFGAELDRYGKQIASMDEIASHWKNRRHGVLDRGSHALWLAVLRAKRGFSRIKLSGRHGSAA